MKTRIALIVLCVLGPLPATGCGSDNDDADQASPPAPPATTETQEVIPPEPAGAPRGTGLELLEKPGEVKFERFGFRYGVRVVAAETTTETLDGQSAPPGEEFVVVRLDITNLTNRKAGPVIDVVTGLALRAYVKEDAATDEHRDEPRENLPGLGEAGCRNGFCYTAVQQVDDPASEPSLSMDPHETVSASIALPVKESKIGEGDVRLVLTIPSGTRPKSGRLG